MPAADASSTPPPMNPASPTSPRLSIPSPFTHPSAPCSPTCSSSSRQTLFQDQEPLLPGRQHSAKYPGKKSPPQTPPSRSSWVIMPFVWLGCLMAACYNRTTAWLFPNEPEPLDLQTTLFFIAQAPLILRVAFTWLPTLVYWLLGIRTSQAGDRGQGKGMRKTWSIRLALALSFLKTYLRFADHLTIEECQRRSRSIPFMTAPAGIRVNKVKIPAYPYRSRAEAMVYDCLSDEERALLSHTFGKTTTEPDSDQEDEFSDDGYEVDQFAEGLDAEWLEYIGPEDTTTDMPTGCSPAAVLYFHGGGYYTGSKEEHRVLIGPLVKRLGKNVRIIIINYRLAPQDPFPAALVDALSSYMWLLDQSVSESFSLGNRGPSERSGNQGDFFQPNQIVFMGDSAGGGLALSLSLLLRDHGSLPQPLSLVTWSPWLDLTQSLPSFKENALTDCIPYDFVHRHSEVVDNMFRHEEEGTDGKQKLRQRAQVYCPDSCLRIKYVSPLFETDFRGIPSVFITCGSAERFANECVLMAARLEEQQQPCRIDIHEDMPHIFPLFRFHASSSTALDRTSAYIREIVDKSRALSNNGNEVIIPISSTSSSLTCSAAPSPRISSKQFERSEADSGSPLYEQLLHNSSLLGGLDRVDSISSISSEISGSTIGSSSPASAAKLPAIHSKLDKTSRTNRSSELSVSTGGRDSTAKRAIVNVIDLSGSSVMSFHKQSRYRPGDASYLDVASSLQRRYHRPQALTLRDVVSDAKLYEWEILLKQGYTPTRHWPHPPSV